ncbi:MAG: leucine-rich repeat protein [Oscillospiraceae bacterium]
MLDSDGLLTIKGTGAMADYSVVDKETAEGTVWISTAPWVNCEATVTALNIEEGATTIGEFAFYNMTTIAGTLYLPENIESIGMCAFRFCGFSGEIRLPSNLKYIGRSAFECCYSITGIVFNDKLESIDRNAFYGNSITSVNLPASVKSIVAVPFNSCKSLENITVDEANPNYCSVDGVLFDKDKTTLIQFPAAKTGNYTVPSTVKTVGKNAFTCSELTEIVLSESIEAVEELAFQNSSATIIFLGKVESMGPNVIDNAENVYFYGEPPVNIYAAGSEEPSFNTNITIHYIAGTEGWDDDGDGLWNGYNVVADEVTPMEQQGFSPVPKERITIPSADAINNNGVDIAIDNNGGYIKNSFGENTNISEIIKNLTSLYSGNQQCLDIKIEKPENAASGKFAISSVTGNNSDDFYYGLPNMSEADAQNINIDENGYMNYWCIYAWSELNGRVWHKEKEITLLWLWWYDADGELIEKEFLSYNTDEYNMPTPLEEVTWDAENYVASGYCGASYHGSKNLAWMLDSEGVLSIEGKGAMENYGEIIDSDGTTKCTSPWADYADKIKKVVIGDGVTLIGSSAFTDARLTADIYFLGDAPSETFAAFNDSATLYYLENKTGWDLEDDGKWHGYNIKTWVVPVPVTNMTLMVPDNIFVGRDEQLSVIIEPENATNKDVIWSVENGTGSATISESGIFTPVSEGTVTVTATADDGSGIFVSKTINVIKSGNGKAFVGITSDVTCKKGLAKVSVELSENSGATTIQFAVSYDADKLSVVSAEAGALMEGKNPDINVSIPGVIVFAWDTDSDSLDLKGSLLDITFVAKETAGGEQIPVEILPDSDEYNFVFASSQDKEYQSIDMTLQNGQIEVVDALLGDVNGDGRINVIDANLVRRSSAEIISLNEVETLTADVNGDGSVDVIDANCIRKYAVKFIKDFVEVSK